MLKMNIPKFSKLPSAIAIDLDGTLLNSQKQLSERNRTAIEKCIERGIPIILNTGRSERATRRPIGDDLANACSLVMANGANARGRPPLSGVIREAISSEVAKNIVELALSIGSTFRVTVEIDGFDFGTNIQLSPEKLWELNYATPDMVMSLDEAIARIPTKITVKGFGQDLSAVGQEIFRQFGKFISVIPSDNRTFLSIVSNRTSKHEALQKLLSSRKIPLDSVLAFGDDVPDLDMLQTCGIPVAIANAYPEIKAVCLYHTASNDEDGVAIVIEQMFV